MAESIVFENGTQTQSENTLWFDPRISRLTASHTEQICKRCKDYNKLRAQLHKKFRTTEAMRAGIVREPLAASAYAGALDNNCNLYPCGLVMSPYSPWLVASPDRKVYIPNRQPMSVLLEIKCPQNLDADTIDCFEVKCNG